MSYALEPSAGDMRAMGEAALDALVDFVTGLPDAPADSREGARELAARFREGAPESDTPFDDVLALIVEASAKSIEYAGPGFMAYIPGGGLYASALAAFLSFGFNRFVNLGDLSPAFAQIEATLLRWMADLFEYPSSAQGILTSGGSMANFSAIVTARKALLDEDFLDGTMYASAEGHHSVIKAAMLAGFPQRNVRVVPTTAELRMDVDALEQLVADDRRAGLRPFLLVANGGTTNTGAVDPLSDLDGLAREHGLWFHVDAAYGGFFQLTERGRYVLRGIELSDSVTLDPHKGMFLPYGTGALLVRDGGRLRDAHHVGAHYLQDTGDIDEIPSFTEYSPELSRDFRGLRVWLPVKLHGLAAFRDALDEKLDLTKLVYDELVHTSGFEVPWEPELTVVPFRYRFRDDDQEAKNRALLDAINASKRVFLSSTMLDGHFTLRVCIVSFRTHRDRVEECVEIIRRCAAELDS